jgi:thioredoxin-related protein
MVNVFSMPHLSFTTHHLPLHVMRYLLVALLAISLTTTAQDEPAGIRFFEGSFRQAMAKAKKENKGILFDAYTTWCGPCKVLKSKVFPNPELGAYINEHFVSIGVDMEAGEGPALANMYPLEGYPTVFFLDASGKVKKKVLGLPQGGAKELLAIAKSIK